MKVTKLSISNFGSFFGSHQIPMSDLGLVFISGHNMDEPKSPSNGAGKSTIFDALDWCLFGEIPRGDSVKSVVNEEAKKDCFVLAELEDAGTKYAIFRTRLFQKTSSLTFWIGTDGQWENRTTLDESETQARIVEALGLDRTIFRAAIYRAQGDQFSFASAPDGERKEMLTALIPELQQVDELRERAKEILQKIQTTMAENVGKFSQLKAEMDQIKAMDWGAVEAQWEASQKLRLQDAVTKVEQAFAQLQTAQAAVQVLPTLYQEIQQLEGVVIPISNVWQQEHEKRIAAQASILAQGKMLKSRMEENRIWLSKLQKGEIKEGACDRCKQPVTGAHLQMEVQKATSIHDQLTQEMAAMQGHSELLAKSVAEAKTYAQQETNANHAGVSAHHQQLGQLKARYNQLMQIQGTIAQLETNWGGWATYRTQIEHEISPMQVQKEKAYARAAVLEAEALGIESSQVSMQHRERCTVFWVDALTAKGLKNMIMDSRIEDMTVAANTWVQQLTAGTTWVRFETQTMTSGGKLSEKLNVRIFRHNPDGSITERNFKSWSGGEKTRVALGVDQGLAKLIADRATKAWDLRILDETFAQNLDHGGREAVFDILQKEKAGTVFVVDHSNGTEGHFDHKWTVRCQNRRSQLFLDGGVSCFHGSSEPQLPNQPAT